MVSKFDLGFWLSSYGQLCFFNISNGVDLFYDIVQCLGLCLVCGMHELEVHIWKNMWCEYLA